MIHQLKRRVLKCTEWQDTKKKQKKKTQKKTKQNQNRKDKKGHQQQTNLTTTKNNYNNNPTYEITYKYVHISLLLRQEKTLTHSTQCVAILTNFSQHHTIKKKTEYSSGKKKQQHETTLNNEKKGEKDKSHVGGHPAKPPRK